MELEGAKTHLVGGGKSKIARFATSKLYNFCVVSGVNCMTSSDWCGVRIGTSKLTFKLTFDIRALTRKIIVVLRRP